MLSFRSLPWWLLRARFGNTARRRRLRSMHRAACWRATDRAASRSTPWALTAADLRSRRPARRPTANVPGKCETVTTSSSQLALFSLDGRRYALPLSEVERVVRAVAVTPVPDSPAQLLGIIDYQGQVIPTLDLRPCFGLPSRAITPDQRLIIGRAAEQRVALLVDEVAGLLSPAEHDVVEAAAILPGLAFQGVVQHDGGVAVILELGLLLQEVEPLLGELVATTEVRP